MNLKKWIQVGVMFLLWSFSAKAATVQCVNGKWTSGTAFSANITATSGNLLWVGATTTALAGGISVAYTLSDGTNTYTVIDNKFISNDRAVDGNQTTYYAKNITGGALTLTVTFGQVDLGILYGQIVVCEASGRDLIAPLDTHTISSLQTSPGSGTDVITSGPITTTAADDVFGVSQTMPGAEAALVAGSSPWISANDNSISGFGQAEYQHQSGAGTLEATFTGSGGSRDYVSAVSAFKPAAAASTARAKVISDRGRVF